MNTIPCPVCREPLEVRLAHSRKAKRKKAFVMLVCPADGRHARMFINDRRFVSEVLARLEVQGQPSASGNDPQVNPEASRRSKTNLEQGSRP